MNWETAGEYEDILYHKSGGVAKVTINRPEKRNAFRPQTVFEMYEAFCDAREDQSIAAVLLTGAGPHTDGKYAFCSGGDQSVRGHAGYVGDDGVPRLNVLDLQKLIRSMPKVVIVSTPATRPMASRDLMLFDMSFSSCFFLLQQGLLTLPAPLHCLHP